MTLREDLTANWPQIFTRCLRRQVFSTVSFGAIVLLMTSSNTPKHPITTKNKKCFQKVLEIG